MRHPETFPTIGRLLRRADFLRAAKGKRRHATGFTLQMSKREPAAEDAAPRIGFTLTRKVGNAIVRNRARRRLKEVVRLADLPVAAGHDYVVIGRIEALRQPFERLKRDLAAAIETLHMEKRRMEQRPANAGHRQSSERGTARKP